MDHKRRIEIDESIDTVLSGMDMCRATLERLLSLCSCKRREAQEERCEDGDGWVFRVWKDRQGRAECVIVFALPPLAGCRQSECAADAQARSHTRSKRHAGEPVDLEY